MDGARQADGDAGMSTPGNRGMPADGGLKPSETGEKRRNRVGLLRNLTI